MSFHGASACGCSRRTAWLFRLACNDIGRRSFYTSPSSRFTSSTINAAAAAAAGSADEAARSAAARKAHWKRSTSQPNFIDTLTLRLSGGRGGDGCIAFARAKYLPYGPPSGGSGGAGGDVYVTCDPSLRSLARVGSAARVLADRGEHGQGDWKGGARGKECVLRVPVGTVVRVERPPSIEELDEDELDLLQEEEKRDLKRLLYEGDMARKYAGAYARLSKTRRRSSAATMGVNPISSSSVIAGPRGSASQQSESRGEREEVDPFEQRARRDAVWRHYAGGALNHSSSTAPEETEEDVKRKEGAEEEDMEEMMEEEVEEEEDPAEIERLEAEYEATSDIASQMVSFKEAEKRFAFTLLRQRETDLLEQRQRDEEWDVVKSEEDGIWTVDLAERWSRRQRSLSSPKRDVGEAAAAKDEGRPGAKEDQQHLLLAKGGSGGMGNATFLSASHRAPKVSTRGSPGEEVIVHLELKQQADVGLVGLPNAGKSTLIRSMSSVGSTVKVAGYAFTTLSPNLGVVRLDENGKLIGTGKGIIVDQSVDDQDTLAATDHFDGQRVHFEEADTTGIEAARFTLSDLPGLIEGAAQDRGLGHWFLRHVERCAALFYVVDVGPDSAEPWLDVELLAQELETYKPGLSDKIKGIVANKCDLMEPKGQAEIEISKKKLQMLKEYVDKVHGRSIEVYHASAKHRLGVERVARGMSNEVRKEEERIALLDEQQQAQRWES